MAKQVFSPEEVAHKWAQQAQESGRDAGSRIYFDRKVIYSYGSHYKIGVIHDVGRLVLINSDTNSQTTNRHRGYVMGAVSHYDKKIVIPHLFTANDLEYGKKECLRPNINYFIERVQEAVERQKKAKKVNYLGEIRSAFLGLLELLNTFEGFGELNEWEGQWLTKFQDEQEEGFYSMFERLDVARLDAQRAVREAYEAKLKKQQEEAVKEAELMLKYWKKFTHPKLSDARTVKNKLYNLPYTALRVDEDGEIETSKGIGGIKKSDAKKIWKVVEKVVKRKQGIQFDGGEAQYTEINGYKLDLITSEGTLHAGCHTIPYKELKYAATKLGFISK